MPAPNASTKLTQRAFDFVTSAGKAASSAGQYVLGNEPYLNDWFSQYSPMDQQVARDEMDMANPLVRKIYRGTPTLNPMGDILRIHGSGLILPEDMDEVTKSIGDATLKENVETAVKALVESSEYHRRLDDSTQNLQKRLNDHYAKTQHNPIYASTEGRRELERHFRDAKIEMHERHEDEVKDFVTAMDSSKTNWQNDFLALAKVDPKKITDSNEQKTLCAEYLLSPLHNIEANRLEQAIDKSRKFYYHQHDKNFKWAQILEQQDPRLFAVAQKIHDNRCEENLKLLQQKEDADEEEKKKIAFSVSLGYMEKQNALADSIRLANQVGGLPTLEDFKTAAASEEMMKESIKFRFARSTFNSWTGTVYRSKPMEVTFTASGQMCVKFPKDLKDHQILASTEIAQACEDVARTLWTSYDQKEPYTPPENRQAELVATSSAYAKVLIREAVAQGFNPKNLTLIIRADVANESDRVASERTQVLTAEQIQFSYSNAIRLGYKARKYKDERNSELSAETVLSKEQEPTLGAAVKTAKDAAELERILNDQTQAYEDTVNVLETIERLGSDPNVSDEDFSQALDKLNSLQFASESSTAASAADHNYCADTLFRKRVERDPVITVKSKYSAAEKAQIVENAVNLKIKIQDQREDDLTKLRDWKADSTKRPQFR